MSSARSRSRLCVIEASTAAGSPACTTGSPPAPPPHPPRPSARVSPPAASLSVESIGLLLASMSATLAPRDSPGNQDDWNGVVRNLRIIQHRLHGPRLAPLLRRRRHDAQLPRRRR